MSDKISRIKSIIKKTMSMRNEGHENLYEFIIRNNIPITVDDQRVFITFSEFEIEDSVLNNLEELVNNIHDKRS